MHIFANPVTYIATELEIVVSHWPISNQFQTNFRIWSTKTNMLGQVHFQWVFNTVYVKSFVVYLIFCFSRMTKIHEIFPLNKLYNTKLITLQETTTHLMNYQHYALHVSRAYVLEDNRGYTISLNNSYCAYLVT